MDGFSATTLSQTARIKTAPFLDIALRDELGCPGYQGPAKNGVLSPVWGID